MPSPKQLRLYFETLRRLRWEQVAYRVVRRVQARLPWNPPVGVTGPTSARFQALARAADAWAPSDPDATVRTADRVSAGTFEFLNRSETLPEVNWTRRYVNALWSYDLHAFGFAPQLAWSYRLTGEARFARTFERLALEWIAQTEGRVGDGWHMYPVAVRIFNWIHALLVLGDAVEPAVRERIERSLTEQSGYLASRLELHILGSHFQKDLTALVAAGLYMRGDAPARWLRRGRRLLWRELREQTLDDGCQFERSPMYHAIALGDHLQVLSLLRAAKESVPAEAERRVSAMLDAFGVLCRPDGRLHLFNDAANGNAPSRAWLDRLGRTVLGRGVPAPTGELKLPDAGYFGWTDAKGRERVMVDCGEPGPSYQPGHGHCDMLSFELDVDGQSLVVDSGVSGYEDDPLRSYVRSTRAHSTVQIGEQEQSEVWGTFRMARRAVPRGVESDGDAHGFRFVGACSPYHDRRATHRRTLQGGRGRWTVTDRVDGAHGVPLRGFLHLHPDWRIEINGSRARARANGRTVEIGFFGVDGLRLVAGAREPARGWYCPEFGIALEAPVVEMTIAANDGHDFGYVITWDVSDREETGPRSR